MVSYGHLWNESTFGSFGHTSLLLSNGVYISYWPKDEMKEFCKAIKGGDARWYQDAETEMREHGIPTKTIPILDLDVGRITKWWENLKQSDPQWTLLKYSCSNIVYEALCEGHEWFRGRKEGIPSTPEAVIELVEKGFLANKSYKISCASLCKPCKEAKKKGD